MTNGAVTLAYTEWTLVELNGAPIEAGADELRFGPLAGSGTRSRAGRQSTGTRTHSWTSRESDTAACSGARSC